MINSRRSLRDVCLIKDLHPGKAEWTIHCQVTCKRPIRTFGSQYGEGEIMSVDLADASGEIRGVAFNEVAHRIDPLLKMNKVYIISDFSGSLLPARTDCTALDHKYEIHFGEITYIAKKMTGSDTLPAMKYNFVRLADVPLVKEGKLIDVAGIVVRDGGLDSFEHQDREVSVREVMLADQSFPGVKVKIWGTEAENLDCSSKPVLVIKDIKVRSSRDSSTAEYLSTCTSTFMRTNPDMEVEQNLRKWYEGKYARTMTTARVKGTDAPSTATMTTANHKLQDGSLSNNEQASTRNPHRILSEPSDKIRRIIENAVKNGAVEIQVGKCVLLGPPEAGKTQLKGALLEEFAEVQESTPASTQATPVIQLLVAGSTKWEHFNLRHMRTFSTRKNLHKKSLGNSKTTTTHPREDTGMQFRRKKSDRSREPAAVRIPGSNVLNSPQSHPKSAKMKAKSKSNWEIFQSLHEAVMHELLKESRTSTTDSLEAIRLIYVVDSGGQPSFIDFHSVTATFPASYLLVYNMEQGLDWKPPYTLRKKIDTKVLPNNTQSNADMIYRSLLTVHHLKSKFFDRNKQIKTLLGKNFCPCAEPPILIVGTHKDQVLKVSERSQMDDDEENHDEKKLKCLYQNIPLMRQVMHTYFVDSLSEGCEGIKELRKTISDKGSLCSFRLPLSWFHLHLMAMSLESEEKPNRNLQVQSYGDLCEMCMRSGLVKSEEEFKAMIMVLHSLGVFSCPDFELRGGTDDSMAEEDIIFLTPSVLYGYVSVLLEIPFRNLDRTRHKPSLLRLQESGELTPAALTELEIPKNLGSCKDFHKSLLKWLVNWGLAAKMDGEERYFIPSALPPKADPMQPVRGAKCIDPFPLYICFVEQCSNNFTFHYLPDGIFPHFIVNLVKAGYILPQNNPDSASTDSSSPRCRNAILLIRQKRQFNCNITFNVQLTDNTDRLSVNMYPADASAPSATVLKEAGRVLSELKQIMQETNQNSNHASSDELRLCLRCPCTETEGILRNFHLSQLDREGSYNIISCLHSKRLEIGAWERRNSSKSITRVLQGFYKSSDSPVDSSDSEESCQTPASRISSLSNSSHSGSQHLDKNVRLSRKRSSKSCRGHSQTSYYKGCSDSDEQRGKGTNNKRYHSDPEQSRLQNEPPTGPDLAINSTTDLAPYLDKMKTQFKLLGCVLGIQDETAAIEKTSEDSTTKCLQILEHWLKVTANPSWSLLCAKLKVSESFNNVREQIEKVHFQQTGTF